MIIKWEIATDTKTGPADFITFIAKVPGGHLVRTFYSSIGSYQPSEALVFVPEVKEDK